MVWSQDTIFHPIFHPTFPFQDCLNTWPIDLLVPQTQSCLEIRWKMVSSDHTLRNTIKPRCATKGPMIFLQNFRVSELSD